VIGMCLTGAFPLALLPVPAVTAAVVCQPTVPFNAFTRLGWFTDESALGLHPDDLAAARTQSRAQILGLRYTGDRLSRPQRFRRLTKEFGDRFYRLDIVGKGHSTLASSFCPQAFLEVSALFNSYVKAAPDTSVPAFPVRARRASEDEVDLCICQTATHHE
jgi:hypothetical protein